MSIALNGRIRDIEQKLLKLTEKIRALEAKRKAEPAVYKEEAEDKPRRGRPKKSEDVING